MQVEVCLRCNKFSDRTVGLYSDLRQNTCICRIPVFVLEDLDELIKKRNQDAKNIEIQLLTLYLQKTPYVNIKDEKIMFTLKDNVIPIDEIKLWTVDGYIITIFWETLSGKMHKLTVNRKSGSYTVERNVGEINDR